MIEKKYLKIIGLITIGISIICYFYFTKGNSKQSKISYKSKFTVSDTLKENKIEVNDLYGEKMYTISNKAFLRISPNSNSKIIDTFLFGRKVYIKRLNYDTEERHSERLLNNERQNGYIAVYFASPKDLLQEAIGFINEKTLVNEYEFKEFKKYFSIKEFTSLESKNKRIIMENSTIEGNSYYLTQDVKRAPKVLVTGDFDGDGLADLCVVLDNMEEGNSAVLVFLNNSETKEPYLAFSHVFHDYMKIVKKQKGNLMEFSGTVKELEHDVVCAYSDEKHIAVIFYDEIKNKLQIGTVIISEEEDE